MLLLELLINFIVMALLGTTITYCWILNKRITVLQNSRSELAELLRHFDESTNRASESIMALQMASKKIGETIQARIEKANYVADDLSFLIERGGRVSSDIQQGALPPPRANPGRAPDMAEAERAVRKAREAASHEEPEEERPRGGMSTLQSMLEKLASRATSDPALRGARAAGTRERIPHPSEPEAKARSRTEQELLELLRANNKV